MKTQLTYENVRYGMLVEVLNDSGYHSGCKVHFFNKKGVLIGNYYEFLPYERLRLREPDKYSKDRNYPRYFYEKSYEKLKFHLFKIVLNITSRLIRFTQPKMD